MWLTRLALRNPVFILMLSLMVGVLGVVAIKRLPVDLLPDLNVPLVNIAAFYPGAGPEDIEKTITMPIERAVASAPGVIRVDSNSRQGTSTVSVWFDRGVSRETAQVEVQQRVNQALGSLPPGVSAPTVMKFDPANMAVVMMALTSDELDERQLGEIARNVIEPQLVRVPGVASAVAGGGRNREIQVRVDRDALRARSLAILDVVEAVRRANLILPSGNLRAGDTHFNVFTNTQIRVASDLAQVVLRPAGGVGPGGLGQPGLQPGVQPVLLSDVAQLVDGAADQYEVARIDGRRGVLMRVMKQPGANTVAVVDAIRGAMKDFRDVPPSVRYAITFDQSVQVRGAISALEHEALWGGGLAVLVILVFLGSLTATGIVAIAIPMSVIAALILLYFLDFTLNIFTLSGLALAIGRLVDDSIVELENIHRHLERTPDRRKAVLDAAQEVAMPILVSTITTVVVFLPVVLLKGINRDIFSAVAITLTFALAMSFLVSRTVTPLLCLAFLRATPTAGVAPARRGWLRRGLDWIDDSYASTLRVALRHRPMVLVLIAGAFVGSLAILPRLGREFMPKSDEARVSVAFRAPTGTRIERTEEVTARIEGILTEKFGKAVGERDDHASDGSIVRNVWGSAGTPTGRSAFFSQSAGPHAGSVDLNLVPRFRRSLSDVEVAQRLNAILPEALPGVLVTADPGGILRRILRADAPFPLEVEIYGQDLDVGFTYADRLLGKLRGLVDTQGRPLLIALRPMYERNYPELHVEVDRQKAGVLGITAQQVAQTVLTSFVGNTQFAPIPFTDPDSGYEYFINVRLQDRFRGQIGDLSDLFVRSPTGGIVQLASLAEVSRRHGPVAISRRNAQRLIAITGDFPTYADLGSASLAVARVLAETPPPEGFGARLGGDVEAQTQMLEDIRFGLLLALALVYMVLASQFKSYLDPLVIMFSVPLGISGVLLALWTTNSTLNVNSGLGAIMMIGIVVSNGVLLVDFANVLRRRGHQLIDATVEAARTRLRPILMTSLATVVGLVPMAVGFGEGGETNTGLARAVIGGITVSTVFTLFLVPVLYTLAERWSRRRYDEEVAA